MKDNINTKHFNKLDNSALKIKNINGISLFANVGIDETYFKDNGIQIKVSNELLQKRADFYRHLYPDVNMICGDITNKNIFNQLINEYKKNNCEFLIATPPCQGMSNAGKRDKNDIRNKLITQIIDFIKIVQPKNIIIENVPQILKTYIELNKKILIVDYIKENLEPLGYYINYQVLDASDYNTPQYRKRAIFLISKIKKWQFPEKNKLITVRDAIGDLPSLESEEKSNIKYHYAKKHNKREIEWLKHTPTGKTALDNEIYYPKRLSDSKKIKCFHSCYQRLNWDKPATTITMNNGSLSSQSNGHPGRLLSDGTYSDARVLTILELLRLTGLPDNWDIPDWASDNLIRQVIGECFPPKFASALLTTMPLK